MKSPRLLNLDDRRPVFLIMDASPIVMLAAIGKLDWLFEPCGTVYMTDMVMEEVTREPEDGDDPRREWLEYTRSWIQKHRFRIRKIETATFSDYQLALEGWKATGSVPERKPKLRHKGEASVRETQASFRGKIKPDETIIVLMDDGDGRDMLRGLRRVNLDVFGTRVFIDALHESFGIADAATAWQALLRVIPTADPGEEVDPFYVRKV